MPKREELLLAEGSAPGAAGTSASRGRRTPTPGERQPLSGLTDGQDLCNPPWWAVGYQIWGGDVVLFWFFNT